VDYWWRTFSFFVFFPLNFGVEFFFFYLLENSKVVCHASLLTVIYPRRSKGLAWTATMVRDDHRTQQQTRRG
jgi:hypothetical protein